MAQLGNLLVTGSGRFLQKVYFGDALDVTGTISTNGLNVGNGIKLSSTKVDFAVPVTISSNLTVQNGIVSADRINSKSIYVSDVLNATRYEIATIQSLGGIFDVCPAFKTSSSATATITNVSSSINLGYNFDGITSVSLSGYYRLIIKDTKQITSNTLCGSTWTRYSKVKITGSINNIAYNSIDAYLLYDLNSNTAGAITLVVPKSAFDSTLTGVANIVCPNVDIILTDIYKSVGGATAKRRPVGMYLASYNGSMGTGVTIYDGNSNDPTLLLGDLTNSSLPTINGLTPQGWGLYATNAYLQGIIVSESGKIGGFEIDSNSLFNGTFGTLGSVLVSTGTTVSASIGGSENKTGWAFAAGDTFGITNTGELYSSSGKIAGWSIKNDGITHETPIILENGTIVDYEVFVCPMTDRLNNFLVVHNKTSDRYPFYVRGDGMYCEQGKIGGWNINSSSIYRTNNEFKNSSGMYFGTSGLSIKDKFYVDTNGEFCAKSGYIGNFQFSENGFVLANEKGIVTLGEVGHGVYVGKTPNGGASLNYDGSISAPGNITSNGNIISNGNITSNGNIWISNGSSLRSYDTQKRDMHLIGLNASDNVIISYGTYAAKNKSSNTYLCAGHDIILETGWNSKSWKPYYGAGDTFTAEWNGAGFITSSGTQIYFSVPISKPVTANDASISWSDGGLVVRQASKYLYGSSASKKVAPSSVTISIQQNFINIKAVMSNTTNVTNNDACGINAKFKITFI